LYRSIVLLLFHYS